MVIFSASYHSRNICHCERLSVNRQREYNQAAVEMKQAIRQVLDELPDDRVREVLDFARFLAQSSEADGWREFGPRQLARAYGDDEPEYSEADLKTRVSP